MFVKTNPLFILGPGVLLAIATIAPECQPKPTIGEPEHTDQSQTQQESDQLVAYATLDALAVNTNTATGTLLIGSNRNPGPKDFL